MDRAGLECIWSSADARLLCVPPLTLAGSQQQSGIARRPTIEKDLVR